MVTTYPEQRTGLKSRAPCMETTKIMIVDDNTEFLEELHEMLTQSGYHVEVVADSGRAIELARTMKPELILIDLKMSPKSGFQLSDELRRSPDLNDIPIIAMTGFFTEKEHVLMMRLCGIKTFILKQFNHVNLISKIDFGLGRREEEIDNEST
jgi:DNA-binding response OmpR family regulator